jgi:hypothetical protein
MVRQLATYSTVIALATALALPAAGDRPTRPHDGATVVVEERDGGFDWGDAAIGVAGALGLAGVAAGAATVLRYTATRPQGRNHV